MGVSIPGKCVVHYINNKHRLWPAETSLAQFSAHGKYSIRISMACYITSDSDFDKGGCVIQIEWTKALLLLPTHALN